MNIELLALTRVPGLGGATIRKLLAAFGTAEAVFRADRARMLQVPRVKAEMLERLQPALEEAKALAAAWAQRGLTTRFWGESGYPRLWQALSDPPMVVFYRGSLVEHERPAIAIVGSRSASAAGLAQAHDLAKSLAESGLLVISGLAAGIDGAAHRGAQAGSPGATWGVSGCGIDRCHPPEHAGLVEDLVEGGGCILTEQMPGARAQARTLMARNRLVVAGCRAVVVVEAGAQGGSLDAAQKASRLGVPVWARPGSPGCDRLLQEGAREFSASDFLQHAVKT